MEKLFDVVALGEILIDFTPAGYSPSDMRLHKMLLWKKEVWQKRAGIASNITSWVFILAVCQCVSYNFI